MDERQLARDQARWSVALLDADWKAIDEKHDQFLTSNPAPATTTSAEMPILTEPDGTKFYDGDESLRVTKADGKISTWRLPAEAVGNGDVTLIHASEDRLFLFNNAGRVIRIKPTPQAAEPFEVEATFTKNIPNADHPRRIWLDPAGRLIIIYESSAMAICFPSGHIPQELARKMTAKDLASAEE